MEKELKNQKFKVKIGVKIIGVIIGLLLIVGLLAREYFESQVFGNTYRYNMSLAGDDGLVAFVSFDPEEKQVFVIPFPKDLEIKSRSVGEYRVGSLYKLGEYEDNPGEFVRRKMQGFMRVPILGYLSVSGRSSERVEASLRHGLWRALWLGKKESSLSRWDAGLLILRTNIYSWKEVTQEELIKSGVIENIDDGLEYYPERLKQYLALKVFDWRVGETNVTITVINASGENGLGSDISEFLRNIGFDVVAVRGAEDQELQETSTVLVGKDEKVRYRKLLDLLSNLFHWTNVSVTSTAEYRSELVVVLGRDSMELF